MRRRMAITDRAGKAVIDFNATATEITAPVKKQNPATKMNYKPWLIGAGVLAAIFITFKLVNKKK
jgi:hypothetical protein